MINASGTCSAATLLMVSTAPACAAPKWPSEAERYRQPADDHPRRPGQGRQGPRSSAEPALLETLRATGAGSSREPGCSLANTSRHRAAHLDKTVWIACNEAARSAGIRKRVTPTRCATVGPRTCWKGNRSAHPSSFCSATVIWRPRLNICTSRSGICSRSRTR